MWFRKKKNIDLFNHELIQKMDAKVSDLLKIPIAKVDKGILEKLSKTEQEQSCIPTSELLLIFKNENDELAKFVCLTFSRESKFSENNEEVNKSNGLSQGFCITYCIYYFFLRNNKNEELGEYLMKRRIPKSQQFRDRLIQNFMDSKGVMLSNSYIQYASGYEKEDVQPQDISKAIKDLQGMDDEHGAFWISVLKDDVEFVIQVNKLKTMTLIEGELETDLACENWAEVEEIYNLQIANELDNVLKRFKK